MGWQALKRKLGVGAAWLLLGSSVFGVTVSRAKADDEVLHRLTKYGKLSASDARRVSDTVTTRMKRAADVASASDPLRMAVSSALVGAPAPADAMSAAKVRLRLYAGLNQWALDNLFAPRSGALANCANQFGLPQGDCQALVAAAGNTSIAEASRLGAGAATGAAPAPAGGNFGRPAPAGGGYGYAAQPAFAQQRPAYGQPAYGQAAYGQPRPAYGQPAYGQPAYGQPAPGYYPAQGYAPQQQGAWARPAQPVARPMVPAGPPPPSAATVASRKAEYEKQRQAYLDRKRQEMEARKGKIMSATDGAERVQRGPSSEDEAAIVGMSAPNAKASAASKATTKTATASAKPTPAAKPVAAEPEAPAAEEEPAKPAPKGQLDTDFLSGLMNDPLGKK